MKPALMIHGGAWRIDSREHEAHLRGVEAAAGEAWMLLQNGVSALDAVQKAVMMLEDDPAFDAGTGSVLNRAGEIEMDAIIMDGSNLQFGAVAAVKGIRNPIHLARLILDDVNHNMLAGDGAQVYATMHGIQIVPQTELIIERELQRFYAYQQNPPTYTGDAFTQVHSGGTVGAVAMDSAGNIAAATSTGGTAFSLPGRVGDSPLVGSGTYADNESGGASATGHGERIMQVVLAKHATDLIRTGYSAGQAAEQAIDYLHRRVQGYGGVIVIDKNGQVGFAHNTPHMAVAWYDDNDRLQLSMEKA